MSKRPFDPRRDGGALLLFVAGTLVSVLMVMVLTSDGPLSSYTGTAAIAEPFVNAFGTWPTLLFAAGMAFLGARTFLIQGEASVLRHSLGLAGMLIGLASVLGAFEERAGGTLGALIGGQIATAAHPVLGALVGVGLAAGVGWYVWLRAEVEGDAPQDVRQSLGKSSSDTGVSREEAAGLVPAELEEALEAGRRSLVEHPVTVASPYPEDVRLRGEIPAGTKPLEVRASHPAPAAAVVAATTVKKSLPEGVKPLFEEHPEPEEEPEFEESVGEAVPLPAQPSWETTGLNEEDEPVDAYGTPLSVIKAVRPDGEQPPVVEPVTASAAAAQSEEPPVEEPPIRAAWESLSEEDALIAEFDQLEEEILELEAAVESVDDEAQQGLETVAELEVESELEEEEASDAELEEEEEQAPEAELEETPVAELEEEEEAPEAELDEEPVAEAQEVPVIAQVEPPRAPIAQTTIFDFAPAEESVELFPEEEVVVVSDSVEELSEVSEPETEPEVVLQPQAVAEERAHKLPAIDPERAKLLREIGCLFVDNGRVAVSMLQRKYSMEFDDACKVLDELQQLGLIGPYLGGQRRDILMSRDQWLEAVGAD